MNLLPTTTDQVLQSVSLAAVSVAAILLTALAFRLPAHHGVADPDAGSGRRTRSAI